MSSVPRKISRSYDRAGTEVTFHVRPNLTFSDGTPLNATAIKDAITRARTQQNSALIKDLEPVSNVTTTGGYDVNVYLNHPESTNTG